MDFTYLYNVKNVKCPLFSVRNKYVLNKITLKSPIFGDWSIEAVHTGGKKSDYRKFAKVWIALTNEWMKTNENEGAWKLNFQSF